MSAEMDWTPVTDSDPAPMPEPVAPMVTPLTVAPPPTPVDRSPLAGITVENPVARATSTEPAEETAHAPVAAPDLLATRRAQVQRMLAYGAHLTHLPMGEKLPPRKGWKVAAPMTEDEAVAHPGNLGVNLALTRMAVIECETALGTQLMMQAGYTPTVLPAKSLLGDTLPSGARNRKRGGAHFWFRVPDGIDPTELPEESTGHCIPGGTEDDKIDMLGGWRYVVAPPSALTEAGGAEYQFAAGGLGDPTLPMAAMQTLPAWSLDADAPCPEGLEFLRGKLAPKPRRTPREQVERSARSAELSGQIDAVPWDQWLAGQADLVATDQVDGCGCPVWHFKGADGDKSVTLHDGCAMGNGAHVWSGTMIGAKGLDRAHYSRLDFAVLLLGSTRRDIAAVHGITLGSADEELGDGMRAEDFEAEAAALEARAAAGETTMLGNPRADGAVIHVEVGAGGLLQRAQRYRSAAAVMGAWTPPMPRRVGETFTEGPVLGAPATTDRPMSAALAVAGLPPVDPHMEAYRRRAGEELGSSPVPIDTTSGYAHGLLPADTRSLADAVAGPRATPNPVDVEATDGQLAQAVAAAIGGTKLVYAADAETWYGWDGNRWAIDAEAARGAVQGLLQRQGQATAAAERQRMIRAWAWKKLTNEQKLRAAKEWDGFSIDLETGDLVGPEGVRIEQVAVEVPAKAEETRTRNAVVAQLASNPRVKIRTEALDSRSEVIGTPGAYLHLTKNTEEPVAVTTPDPSAGVTKLLGAAYDPAATCPRWTKLLADALPSESVRRWLQKAYGQALFGLQEEHLVLVLEGQGGNGKGGVVDVLTAVFGDYSATLQTSVFTLAGMNNHSTDLMPLRGARFATADEVPPQQLNIDRVKKFSGGGRGSARLCGQDQTEWDLSHTLCLMTNNRLQWPPSAMQAMRRRLRVVKFEVAFGEPGHPPMISGLAAAIVAEEASGVLNWLLDGWAMYVAEGLSDVPAEIEEWTQATLAASSSWSGFCDLAFEITKNAEDVLLSADIFPLWDYYRGLDTDQKHASPGSTRVVAAMVVEQLRGVTRIEAKGKVKAGVRGVRWSEDGLALLEEMRQAGNPFPFLGPNPAPVVPPGM
ncbi:bacteriophage protein [Mycobacteroides abscessus subsp. massiliense]|uniref:phage/plasmid primase, P4 family n=1 Tax=Mycobacteroides abscessus TaxID=36809 RepID=UPI0009A66D47|nr:phage/plasmid primase, P4 family [Mycobacteroides abscessus]SKG49188.1 bacteriophage protein [Mycobacteroides abscessus subsp. massiliense]SKH00661.1 bacteriophage protein [Mycobacteroides abscessus subsp. massiliense]SKH98121.1 bacteriophage protein [Mycobacteroides abscessus subsp. massiliense]SKJ26876.1 bacteriophage protein [Mycobacteroides abscessus subsp. massiliense]